MTELQELLNNPLVIDVTIWKDGEYIVQVYCNNFHIISSGKTCALAITKAVSDFKNALMKETN